MNLIQLGSSLGRRCLPAGLKHLIRQYVPMVDHDVAQYKARNPYADDDPVHDVPGSRFRLGIVAEFCHYHKVYIAACRELGVSYRVLDLAGPDWLDRVHRAACDAFLVWPSSHIRACREMFDDRLRCMEMDLGLRVFPSYHETWLYENKRRTADWLAAHRVSHPRTWVFYRRQEAVEFARQAALPLVVKTNIGASHSGVWILRDRHALEKVIARAFRTGLAPRGRLGSEREFGVILLQEYVPDAREWRLVRVGDSYFGHLKGKGGEFHSGSGLVDWSLPEPRHLQFLKEVTDLGGFASMDVDVFEAPDGRLLVNELQTVFGAGFAVDQMRCDGKAGRFIWDSTKAAWQFQEGDFARNACANARVEHVLARLSK